MRREKLANGLRISFHDKSNRYYGDYHRVCIEVRCTLPLTASLFAAAEDPVAEYLRVRALLGEELSFCRTLEKMGVAGAEVESTRDALIESFLKTAAPYLETPDFPARLAAQEAAKKKVRRPPYLVPK